MGKGSPKVMGMDGRPSRRLGFTGGKSLDHFATICGRVADLVEAQEYRGSFVARIGQGQVLPLPMAKRRMIGWGRPSRSPRMHDEDT